MLSSCIKLGPVAKWKVLSAAIFQKSSVNKMIATGSFFIMASSVIMEVWSPNSAENFIWFAEERTPRSGKLVAVTYPTCSQLISMRRTQLAIQVYKTVPWVTVGKIRGLHKILERFNARMWKVCKMQIFQNFQKIYDTSNVCYGRGGGYITQSVLCQVYVYLSGRSA